MADVSFVFLMVKCSNEGPLMCFFPKFENGNIFVLEIFRDVGEWEEDLTSQEFFSSFFIVPRVNYLVPKERQ